MTDLDRAVERINRAYGAMTRAFEAVQDLGREELQMTLGMVIDLWSAKNGLSSEDTFELTEQILAVQKMVHEQEGAARM